MRGGGEGGPGKYGSGLETDDGNDEESELQKWNREEERDQRRYGHLPEFIRDHMIDKARLARVAAKLNKDGGGDGSRGKVEDMLIYD